MDSEGLDCVDGAVVSDAEVDAQVRLEDIGLRINELMSKNDGVLVDEQGETEDWIELYNTGTTAVSLRQYRLSDGFDEVHELPDITLQPGDVALLFADGETEQGITHLPFRLDADGDWLFLWSNQGVLGDMLEIPPLSPNQSLARFPDAQGGFEVCRYATPGALNGATCMPPAPPELNDVTFADYVWPESFPGSQGPLVITELALNPTDFIEILNLSDQPVPLSDFALRVDAYAPGEHWPGPDDGVSIALGNETLQPNARTVATVSEDETAILNASPEYEGVVTLFSTDDGQPVDRVDFMSWPQGSVLARLPDAGGTFRYCTNSTAGEDNLCTELPSRSVGTRLGHLRTPGDFDALAEGATELGIASVKFIVDMEMGDQVYLLSSRDWDLHYTFVREFIDHLPRLDRCDPLEYREFRAGWASFSESEYFSVDRRYLLGTLSHHGGADLKAVEYTFGDRIIGEQMRRGFFTVAGHLMDPQKWFLRPQDERQVEKARDIEGTLPIVGPNAPFQDVSYQPLTNGIGYGYLRFIPANDLENAQLGPDVIVVTDDVPNDIALVGGLITEAFQTPLSHVNVLSKNRGTPNMALRGARAEGTIAPYLDKLVRLEVLPAGFTVEEAEPTKAEAFWESLRPQASAETPRLDDSLRGVQPLWAHDMESLPAIGAKAAQLAELYQIDDTSSSCAVSVRLSLPENAFAIPVAHYLDHFEQSGARSLLESLSQNPSFDDDPVARGEALQQVREAILTHPVDASLLSEVEEAVSTRFGDRRVRFRSSSNTEDLPSFSGAGLYTSLSGALNDDERKIDNAIRTVWASLWNERAYDERAFARIDSDKLAMGILVHEAFLSERANGVAISRNILDPIRGDIYYINAQIGEASVTNPAPGVSSEQLTYQWPPRTPTLVYQSQSSLTEGARVLEENEVRDCACALRDIHDHFRPLVDPKEQNRWYAMEIEFKLIEPERNLLIKQARPYSFGEVEVPIDCREFE